SSADPGAGRAFGLLAVGLAGNVVLRAQSRLASRAAGRRVLPRRAGRAHPGDRTGPAPSARPRAARRQRRPAEPCAARVAVALSAALRSLREDMSQAQTTPAAITELKVSAHLMLLDPGVFCVFNSPDAAPPDGRTGLPGVRLSAAPAPGGFGGQVSLSGFTDDGWLGGVDGAALVRVSGGPAQVLVTVYQSAEGGHEPPKLQVLRLT